MIVPAGTSFLNADLIAEGLVAEGHSRPGLDVAAGRILLDQLEEVVTAGESFCIETNLADRGHARRIAVWHEHGYTVRLVFAALDNPDLGVSGSLLAWLQEVTMSRNLSSDGGSAGLRALSTIVHQWELSTAARET